MFSVRGEINAFLYRNRKMQVLFNKNKQEYAEGERRCENYFSLLK